MNNNPFFDPEFFNIGADVFFRFGMFILIGIVGMIAHGAAKLMKGQIVTLTGWFTTKRRQSILAFTTLFGAAIAAMMSGQMDTMNFTQMCMVAFPVGFTCDSAVNSTVASNTVPNTDNDPA